MNISYDIEAEYLLYQCNISIDTSAPRSNIDLRSIVWQFGIEYHELPLTDDMGGAWIRSIDASVSPHYIYVNSLHPPVRKRFSLGHEIGHFWLGHESDFNTEYKKNDPREIQANRFSLTLNMPAQALYEVHCRLHTIKEIAYWLRVSEISCAIRLLDSGLRTEESELVISDYYFERGDGETPWE